MIFSTVPDLICGCSAYGGYQDPVTLDGEITQTIPSWYCQTDTRIRLKAGVSPSRRNKTCVVIIYVTLVVQVPEKLNNEQKELSVDDAKEGQIQTGRKRRQEEKIFQEKSKRN